MSVLIKGIDMPKCCSQCPCVTYDDCDDPYCSALQELGMPDVVYYPNRKLEDCPLAEVPTQHGKLVDCECKTFPTAFRYNNTSYAKGWNACLRSVLMQPTIMQAEE